MRIRIIVAAILGPVLAAAESKVYDWTANSVWKQETRNRVKGEFLLLDLHAPWCSHCKRLLPELEAVAEVLDHWDLGPDKSVTVAKIDCIQAKRLCAGYGIYSYPTIKIADHRTASIADFPRGPRHKENLLSFVAEHLRDRTPIEVRDEAHWREIKAEWLDVCTDTPDKDSIPLTLKASVCRYSRTNNYIIGMADAMAKINRVFPNLSKAVLQFELSTPFLGLPSADEVCIVDRYDNRDLICLKTSGTDAEIRKEYAVDIKKHRTPLIVKDGNWEDFYRLRNMEGQYLLTMALSEDTISNYGEWMREVAKIAKEFKYEWNAIQINPKDTDVMRIYTQMGVATNPLPSVIAFNGNVEDRKFFTFESGRLDELSQWMQDVRSGKAKGKYPDGYDPSLLATLRKELREVSSSMKLAIIDMGPIGWAVIAVMLTSIVGAFACLLLTEDSGEPLVRAAAVARAALAARGDVTRAPSEKTEEDKSPEMETPSVVEPGQVGAEGQARRRKPEDKAPETTTTTTDAPAA